MAYYLVRAVAEAGSLSLLEASLASGEIRRMRPFGRALQVALKSARIDAEGVAWWEEEDYCSPPLRQERLAVLDQHFSDLRCAPVKPGEGWRQILGLPFLFPSAAAAETLEATAQESLDWLRRQRRDSGLASGRDSTDAW